MAEFLAIRQGTVTDPEDSGSVLATALEAWEQRPTGAAPVFEVTVQPNDTEIGTPEALRLKLGMLSVGFLRNGGRVIRGLTPPPNDDPNVVSGTIRIETNPDPSQPATASVTVRPTFEGGSEAPGE